MKSADSLQYVTRIVFPGISCNWKQLLGDNEGAEAVFKTLDGWNEVGSYVHDHFKEGVESLLSTIEDGAFAKETAICAKQLLAALCEDNVGYYWEPKRNHESNNEVVCRLYKDSSAFREIVVGYARLAPKLVSSLLACSFFLLNRETFEDVCTNCVRAPYPGRPIPDILRERIVEMFRYNHTFENMITKESIDQYWQMGSLLDILVPELLFFENTKDGITLAESKRGIDAAREMRSTLALISKGVYWADMNSIPDKLVLLFRYPNGKNGDVLRYIFEEYGEAEKKSPTLWQGAIWKCDLSLLESFSTILNYITFDPHFFELFDKHHLPTIAYNNLAHVNSRHFGNLLRQETMAVLNDHKLEQKRNREQLYAKVVLTEKATPKWQSEFLLYSIVHESFPDAEYQYYAKWLGTQSLDIFIPTLNVGIEYQGMQHYEPIEFFGGERAFKRNQERDARKRKLCEENGIKLIEWPCKEAITKTNLEHHLHEIGIDSET